MACTGTTFLALFPRYSYILNNINFEFYRNQILKKVTTKNTGNHARGRPYKLSATRMATIKLYLEFICLFI